MQSINLIFATTESGIFNFTPLSADLKHFKNVTTDSFNKNIVVMGKNTWLSLPNKLDSRHNVVISKTMIDGDYDERFDTLEEFLKQINTYDINRKIFIIGGIGLLEDCIKKYKNLIDCIYYSKIFKDFADIDNVKFFNLELLKQFDKYKIQKKCDISDEIIFYKYQLPLHDEFQYLELLHKCICAGNFRKTRNANTYSYFSDSIRFDLKESFPLLTTKKVFMRGIFEELIFFLKGNTDSKILENNGVNIWKPNTTTEFIQKCGLNYKEGDMGPMYGFQWRHFNADYNGCDSDYFGKGVDQLQDVFNLLINDPYSRRILMTTYNPNQAKQGVLYPCHSLVLQFYAKPYTEEGKYYISMVMYQRSVDLACGLPFNITSNALLLNLICATLNKKVGEEKYYPDELIINLGDIHIYEQHIEGVKEQLKRIPYNFPTMKLKNTYDNIEEYKWDDIEILDYNHHPAIKYEMVA